VQESIFGTGQANTKYRSDGVSSSLPRRRAAAQADAGSAAVRFPSTPCPVAPGLAPDEAGGVRGVSVVGQHPKIQQHPLP